MALAQETPVLLMDEQTTFQDIAHQIELLDLVQRLNRDEGRPGSVVSPDLISHVFGVEATILSRPDGSPLSCPCASLSDSRQPAWARP